MSKPTKAESEHMGQVAALGCIVCRYRGTPNKYAQVHHVLFNRQWKGMGQKAPNYAVIPLCHTHHVGGDEGEAIHAGPRVWKWDEEEMLRLTWQLLIQKGVIPHGTPIGEEYKAIRTMLPRRSH